MWGLWYTWNWQSKINCNVIDLQKALQLVNLFLTSFPLHHFITEPREMEFSYVDRRDCVQSEKWHRSGSLPLKKHVHFPLHCSPYSLSLPCSPSSEAGGRSPADDHLIINDLPDVCQTIEVVTENEEQAVTSSDLYPLQISPVSSYGGWLDKHTLHPLAMTVFTVQHCIEILAGFALIQLQNCRFEFAPVQFDFLIHINVQSSKPPCCLLFSGQWKPIQVVDLILCVQTNEHDIKYTEKKEVFLLAVFLSCFPVQIS